MPTAAPAPTQLAMDYRASSVDAKECAARLVSGACGALPLVTVASLAVQRRPLAALPPQQRHPCTTTRGSIDSAERLLFRAASDLYEANRVVLEALWHNSAAPRARLYRLVMALDVPQHKRTQVAPRIDPLIRGMFIGVTRSPGGSASGCRRPAPICSPYSAASAALVGEVRRQLQEADAQFTFSSLYVAVDCRAKLHVDQCNVGASYQMAVGPHEGGVLVEFPLRGPAVGWPANVWNRTDGSRPHLNMPFAGKRVSLIAYTHDVSLAPDSLAQRLAARQLGFPLPSDEVAAAVLRDYRSQPKADVCPASAQLALEELCDAVLASAQDYEADDVIQASICSSFAYHHTPPLTRVPTAIVQLLVFCAQIWSAAADDTIRSHWDVPRWKGG